MYRIIIQHLHILQSGHHHKSSYHLSTTSPILPTPQLPSPLVTNLISVSMSCCFLNTPSMLSTQGQCPCCAFCASPRGPPGLLFCFMSQLKHHLVSKAFPDHPIKVSPSEPSYCHKATQHMLFTCLFVNCSSFDIYSQYMLLTCLFVKCPSRRMQAPCCIYGDILNTHKCVHHKGDVKRICAACYINLDSCIDHT